MTTRPTPPRPLSGLRGTITTRPESPPLGRVVRPALSGLAVAVVLTSCVDTPTTPESDPLAAAGGPRAAAMAATGAMCHYDADAGTHELLYLPSSAVAAHRRHGDSAPGEPVPGMDGSSFDEACTPVQAARPLIAFESSRGGNDEIYVISRDGTGLANLSMDSGTDASPSISADGSRVAFTSSRDGNTNIHVMDVDGTNPVRLTDATDRVAQPTISADGSKVAFLSGNNDIFTIDADGSNLTRVTDDGGAVYYPSLSADGTKVAFVMSSPSGCSDELFVVDSDGGNLTQLTFDEVSVGAPSISGDGGVIAFPTSREGAFQLHVINSSGTGLTRLTQTPASSVDISSDGRTIAFQTFEADADIYVINSDGTGLTQLTDNPAGDDGPSISGDGRYVTFTSDRNGNREIYTIGTDGAGLARLTDNLATDQFPSFSGN